MSGRQELAPGIWAEVIDGEAQIHVDLAEVAAHLGIPEAEAEALIGDATTKALQQVYGPEQAARIPVEIVEDATP